MSVRSVPAFSNPGVIGPAQRRSEPELVPLLLRGVKGHLSLCPPPPPIEGNVSSEVHAGAMLDADTGSIMPRGCWASPHTGSCSEVSRMGAATWLLLRLFIL